MLPSPLAHADWQYVDKRCLGDYQADNMNSSIISRRKKLLQFTDQ